MKYRSWRIGLFPASLQETGFFIIEVNRIMMSGFQHGIYVKPLRIALRHVVGNVFFVKFDHAFFRLVVEAK